MIRTYITVYLKTNRIHVYVEALRGIGSPGRVCFMINRDGDRLLLAPHSKKDFISHAIPSKVYNGIGRHDINSKRMCVIIARQHGWDVNHSYRVPGVILPEKRLAVFDLSKAEKLPGV